MTHLKQFGPVVYLQASLTTLQQRINNFESRGLARSPGQSLAELFTERTPLYESHADFSLDCESDAIDAVLAKLESRLLAK